MRIESTVTVDELEYLYFQVHNVKTIELPNSFKKNRVGLVASAIQFFITISKSISPTVIFHDFDTTLLNESVDEIINDPICLAIILLFDEVYDSRGVPFKRMINSNLVKRLNNSPFSKGHRIQLLAVDHSIETYAYPHCFYEWNNNKAMQGASYYSYLLNNFFRDRVKQANVNASEFEVLGNFLSELVDNTEQHGKSDFISGREKRSIRGVTISYHLIKKNDDLSKLTGNIGSISDYISRHKSDDRALHLLEISVFDSGCGIYNSYRKEVVEGRNEKDVVSNSFLKGVTSKSNSLGYGRGLSKVRQILNQRNGFVKIRSGGVSLFRDYDLNSLSDQDYDVSFYEDGLDGGSGVADVSGVSYSILVPVK